MTARTGWMLPWRGRAARLLALCVFVATASSVWSEAGNTISGYNVVDPPGWFLVVLGLASVVLLAVGALRESLRCERAGLFLAAGYWAGIATAQFLMPDTAAVSGLVSASLSGIAGSLVLLNTIDGRLERKGGGGG